MGGGFNGRDITLKARDSLAQAHRAPRQAFGIGRRVKPTAGDFVADSLMRGTDVGRVSATLR